MRLKKQHWIGITFGVLTLIASIIFLRTTNLFYFTLGISAIVIALPFILTSISESKAEQEKNEMFLQFSRDLVDNVKSGTPISRSIINLRRRNYGALNSNVQKLANQISIGIPVQEAFDMFAQESKSAVISRAIRLIREAEMAGGNIEDILDSVAKSVAETEKLKKERRAAISALVVQGYIIFLIFIAIILVVEFKILPITTEFGDISQAGGELGLGSGGTSVDDLTKPFLFLLLTQGFFAGLVIGKLSEGTIKSGIKHSFFLVIIALVFSTGARIFLT